MGRNSHPESEKKKTRSPKESTKKIKRKPCQFCKEKVNWIDYKDDNLLKRYVSDRGKIRARRVTGNCAQHQRDIAAAVKTARELALIPYSLRMVTARSSGKFSKRGDGDEDRPMSSLVLPPLVASVMAPVVVAEVEEIEVVEAALPSTEGGEE